MTAPISGASTSANAQAREPTEDRDRAIHTAARQFEALLVQQLMQVMRSTTPGLFEGTGGELYGSMFDEAMSAQMARNGGLGLAEVIARSMGAGDRNGVENGAGVGVGVGNGVGVGDAGAALPPSGAVIGGATGALQRAADEMLPSSGIAPQWGREGTLTPLDLASDFHTDAPGGQAYFSVRDARGYQGYYKCNLFALELARRAGFQVAIGPRHHGWGYVGPTWLAEDAADGRVRGDWARVVRGASAAEVDASIVRGERAFLLTGSGEGERRGHMGVVERVHEIEHAPDGSIARIVYDGWEGRREGAMHLTRRVWTVTGHGGGPGVRTGFERIELLELRRPEAGERPEQPLQMNARPSVTDGSRTGVDEAREDRSHDSSSPASGRSMVGAEAR